MSEILQGKIILLVDDEEDLRFILRSEFEDQGCNVLEACDGNEAFELVKSVENCFILSKGGNCF